MASGEITTEEPALRRVITRIREDYLAKGIKFLGVSAVSTVVGQSLLFGFQATGMGPVSANMAAVAISTVPAYLLSRYWVWKNQGSTGLVTQIVSFWALAFAGFALSTVSVAMVAGIYDGDPPKLLVNATNLASFGVLWVAKFLILDRLLFREELEVEVVEARLAEETGLS